MIEVGKEYMIKNDSLASLLGFKVQVIEIKNNYCVVKDNTNYEWLHPLSELME